ncbi:MAG: hypothetical protein AB7P69_26625 [Candidatus Binatia bacterium]
MKTNVEDILETIVRIVEQLDGESLEKEPVLELAKKLSVFPAGSPRLRTVLWEEQTPLRRKPAALSHCKKNAA